MARLILAAVLILALGPAVSSQTTGVPGANDLTVNGFGSGSTSCTAVTLPPPGILVLTVSARAPGLSAFLIFSDAPCVPGVAGPFCGTTLDIGFGPSSALALVSAPTGPGGVTSVAIPVAAGVSGTATLQGLVLDPVCPGGFLFTQAYVLKIGC